jgi:serine/threonine protein phosphatase 1
MVNIKAMTPPQNDSRPPAGHIFAVGDIHGCFRQLSALLSRLPLNPQTDRIIFLGDYINRGPQSREVIELLLGVERRVPGAVFLMGNHEHDLLEYARSGDVELLRGMREMGVEATLSAYGRAPVKELADLAFLPPAHRDFIERLQLFWREPGYLFVHAGVQTGPQGEERPSLTTRDAFLRAAGRSRDVVVFGHTVFAAPLLAPGRIGIDTGAGRGGLLTAVELPELVFHHA